MAGIDPRQKVVRRLSHSRNGIQLSGEVKNKDRRMDDRKTRLAEALRTNLRRRKAQAKRRLAAEEAENPGSAAPTAVNPPQTDPKDGDGSR